jgi:putative SOS response-associated peptidase YedK
MKYIHNHAQRMPVVLKLGDESAWLDVGNRVDEFAYPTYQPHLIGIVI